MNYPADSIRRPALKLLGLVVGLASFLTATCLIALGGGWTEERRVAAAIESRAREGWGRAGPLGLQWPLLIPFVLPGVGLLGVWLFGHHRQETAPKAG